MGVSVSIFRRRKNKQKLGEKRRGRRLPRERKRMGSCVLLVLVGVVFSNPTQGKESLHRSIIGSSHLCFFGFPFPKFGTHHACTM